MNKVGSGQWPISALLAGLLVSTAIADDWRESFQNDLAECESIPADAYETGLLFNPAGRRTYFKRSRCLQRVAIEWRDLELCNRVKQRRSLLFSGNAVSEKACRANVAEQLKRDRERAESIHVDDFHMLVGARLERPHYLGGDYLLHLETEGSHSGSYQIRIEVWPNSSSGSLVIEEYSQPLGSSGGSLMHTICQHKVRETLKRHSMDREVRVRIILELPLRTRTDQFVLALLPTESRRSTLDIKADLSDS
ncbi:MAG: hypothetical protein WD397_02275 [Wenzhouxiangellaceae bacterium]